MKLCEDECVLVEECLQGNFDITGCTEDEQEELEYIDRWTIVDKFSSQISGYKCYKEIIEGTSYGHINYCVASYCVQHNHLECLKYLHKNTALQWHNDLAAVACTVGNIECLKYIVECMGDVKITTEDMKYVVSKECIEYVNINGLINKQLELINN